MNGFALCALFLSICGLILHSAGIYYLVTNNRKSTRSTRPETIMLLINLSISDISFSLHNIVLAIVQELQIGDVEARAAIMDIVVYGLGIPFYIGMFLLTLQRFLEVYLHLRYIGCWFEQNQLLLCLIPWCTFGVFSMTLSIVYELGMISIATTNSICRDVSVSLTFIVILEFLTVYAYIFLKFRAFRYTSATRQQSTVPKRPRLYIPFLIVVTYIIFIFVPDFISVFFKHLYGQFLSVFYYFNVIADALIYIVLKPSVRMRVSKSISMLSQAHRNSYNESQNHRVDSHSELSSNRVNNHIELSVQERERETGTEETVNSDV
jgi:hypothetical protein